MFAPASTSTAELIEEFGIDSPRADALLGLVEWILTRGTAELPDYSAGDLRDELAADDEHPLLKLALTLDPGPADEHVAALLRVRLDSVAEHLDYSRKLREISADEFAEEFPNATRGMTGMQVSILRNRRADAQLTEAHKAARRITDEGWGN